MQVVLKAMDAKLKGYETGDDPAYKLRVKGVN